MTKHKHVEKGVQDRGMRAVLHEFLDLGPADTVWQFGVYCGHSIKHILLRFPYVGRIIGVDSFDGLPAEAAGVATYPECYEGAYSAKAAFKLATSKATMAKVEAIIGSDKVELIQGWFEDVLCEDLLDHLGVKQHSAAYIDADADLYGSTMTLLDFVFKFKLAIPGRTVIGFDDWGCTPFGRGSESKAFYETVQKYSVNAKEVWCKIHPPHIQKLFRIESYE